MASQFFRKRPTAMTRPEFVKRFGGVYEHSPWIAEAVYDARLRPAHDGVKALHTAMMNGKPNLLVYSTLRAWKRSYSSIVQASSRALACSAVEAGVSSPRIASRPAKSG